MIEKKLSPHPIGDNEVREKVNELIDAINMLEIAVTRLENKIEKILEPHGVDDNGNPIIYTLG